MAKRHITPIKQPDENTCGPAALAMAGALIGRQYDMSDLVHLCQTTSYGTTTKKMLRAIRILGLSGILRYNTTLTHIKRALTQAKDTPLALIVCYLYAMEDGVPKEDSGHWAVVSEYSPLHKSIRVYDSYTGSVSTYPWREFRKRWIDYEMRRGKPTKPGASYRYYPRWEPQLTIAVSTDPTYLPAWKNDVVVRIA